MKATLEQDMTKGLIFKIYDAINDYTGHEGRFHYYHDSYEKDGYTVHLHKFKQRGILSRKKLQDLCNHLEEEGIFGFQPTSPKREKYSGVVRYHKVKIQS
jgi:hypothetical protein